MSIGRIIGFHKVSFKKLNELYEGVDFIEGDHINMFINVASITKWLYTKDKRNELMSAGANYKNTIVTELINLALHYRLYYYHFHKMSSSFYFYYSEMSSIDNRTIDANYNMTHQNNRHGTNDNFNKVTEYLNDELSTFKDIIPYIHDCFYINSETIEYSLIPLAIILSGNKNDHNIILSKDAYEYQLINLHDTSIIYPNKDKSLLLYRYNLIDSLIVGAKYKPNMIFNSNMINLISAILGNRGRNINNIKGIGIITILKKIEAVFNNDPNYQMSNILDFIELLFPNMTEINKNKVTDNFMLLDLGYQIRRINIDVLFNTIKSSLVNVRNDKDLYLFNNNLCDSNINLSVIYKGVR